MKIVALDPGITTGYAVGIIDTSGDRPMGVVSGQAKWNEMGLYNELNKSKPDRIIYETFEYRAASLYGKKREHFKVELFPRNLIGVINLYYQERDHEVILYTQSPSAGKAYWSDQLLKKEKVYKVGNPHANDAMRHLLQWYMFGPGFQFNTNNRGFEYLT